MRGTAQAKKKSVRRFPVDPGPAGGGRTTVTIDPTTIDPQGTEELRIDPDCDLPDSHVIECVSPVLLGQPALTVEDIGYNTDGSETIATLTMQNEGPVATTTVSCIARKPGVYRSMLQNPFPNRERIQKLVESAH